MRFKITAGSLAAVVLLGLACFGVVRYQLRVGADADIEAELPRVREMVRTVRRAAGLDLVRLATARAATSGIVEVFSGVEDSRRNRAYDEAERFATELASPANGGRRADFVAILDDTGRVLARDLDRNALAGVDFRERSPSVDAAIRGAAGYDIIRQQTLLLELAFAPIRSREGGVLGVLVVGFDLGNGTAKDTAQRVGGGVAYLFANRQHSTSLEGSAATDLRQLFEQGAGKAALARVLASGEAVALGEVALGGRSYQLTVGALQVDSTQRTAAFAALVDRDARMQRVGPANMILLFTALAAVAVLIYGIVLGGVLLRPIEQMEEGILQVINGRTDLRLDIKSTELGGLAYRVNQLLNMMTGVSEEAEDDGGSGGEPGG